MTLTPFNCPLSLKRADQLVSSLNLGSNDRALDAGCGEASFLARLLRATECQGVGFDIDNKALNVAKERELELVEAGRLRLEHVDLRKINLEDGHFALTICLGSTHAFADEELAFPVSLDRLNQCTQPNGLLLIGECFWQKQPDPDYLNLLGEPVGVYRTFDENIKCAEDSGWLTREANQATDLEWDSFEGDHLRRAEIAADDNPEDKRIAEALKQRREWHAGYQRWGRSTLGFGFYLFQKAS